MADNQIGIKFTGDASGLTSSVNQANKALGNLRTGSSQAQFALTNLSRVAQDAPFGFIGIANNIDPLVQSFAQLRKETGSLGGAFSSLLTSFLGSGGLILGFGLLSSALSFYSMNAQKAGSDTKKLSDEIRTASQVVNDAEDGVQGDILKVQTLAKVVTDASRSYKEREAALQSLRKVNKEYFGDLSIEKSSYEDIALAVEGYTKSLISQAVIEGLKDEISQLAKASREATKEYNTLAGQTITAQKQARAANEQALREGVKGIASVNNVAVQAQTQVQVLSKRLVESANRLQSLGTLSKELNGELQKQVDEWLKITKAEKGSKDTNEGRKVELQEQRKELQSIFDLTARINNAQKEVGKGPANLNTTEIKPIDITGQFTPDEAERQAEEIRTFYGIINSAIQEGQRAIRNGVQDAFFAIGDAFGSALANGGIGQALAAAGQGLLGIIGGVLQQVGKQVILASALVQTLQKTLATLFTNPAAGVAVGVGLVALGGLLKNIRLTKIPAFAEGGIVTGPTFGLVGEAGREAIIPLDRIGEVLGSIGGAQSVFVTGQLSGETIYLQQQRTGDRRGRFV